MLSFPTAIMASILPHLDQVDTSVSLQARIHSPRASPSKTVTEGGGTFVAKTCANAQK